MVKNKVLPDSARLCCTPRLVTFSLSLSLSLFLSLSLADLALSRLVSRVFSLSLTNTTYPEGTPWILPRLDPGTCSNSCPLSWWCHPAISSSVIPFSSYLQSFPASGSFSVSQFFASGGQCIGVLASESVLPMYTHDWFPLGLTDWISLQSKGLSRVLSNTTDQKHQYFSTQLSL